MWDDSKYLPIFVSNKAAEFLFGNFPAEKVRSSYKSRRPCQNRTTLKKDNFRGVHSVASYASRSTDKMREKKTPNFYMIWLILLNSMFQHGKNSPLKFKVRVDTNRYWESGRLEMVSVSFPAFRRNPSA